MASFEVVVTESWRETPTVHVVRCEKPQGFSFKAGQFCLVELQVGSGKDDRSFSICSSPAKSFLEFATRTSGEESEYKKAFEALKQGDKASLMGPFGKFCLDENASTHAMLSGGIGVTPLKSMLEYAVEEKRAGKFFLFYSNRSDEDIAFKKELDGITASNARVVYTITEPTPAWRGEVGRINQEMLKKYLGGLSEPSYYVCGPPGMVQGMRDLLQAAGVPGEKVRAEKFTGYK